MFRQNLPCQTWGLTEMAATFSFVDWMSCPEVPFLQFSLLPVLGWCAITREVWAGCCEDRDPATVEATLRVLSTGSVQTSDEQQGRGSPDAGSGCQLGCSLGSRPALQPRVVIPVISALAQWLLVKLPLCRWDPVTELTWSGQIPRGRPQPCWVWASVTVL